MLRWLVILQVVTIYSLSAAATPKPQSPEDILRQVRQLYQIDPQAQSVIREAQLHSRDLLKGSLKDIVELAILEADRVTRSSNCASCPVFAIQMEILVDDMKFGEPIMPIFNEILEKSLFAISGDLKQTEAPQGKVLMSAYGRYAVTFLTRVLAEVADETSVQEMQSAIRQVLKLHFAAIQTPILFPLKWSSADGEFLKEIAGDIVAGPAQLYILADVVPKLQPAHQAQIVVRMFSGEDSQEFMQNMINHLDTELCGPDLQAVISGIVAKGNDATLARLAEKSLVDPRCHSDSQLMRSFIAMADSQGLQSWTQFVFQLIRVPQLKGEYAAQVLSQLDWNIQMTGETVVWMFSDPSMTKMFPLLKSELARGAKSNWELAEKTWRRLFALDYWKSNPAVTDAGAPSPLFHPIKAFQRRFNPQDIRLEDLVGFSACEGLL